MTGRIVTPEEARALQSAPASKLVKDLAYTVEQLAQQIAEVLKRHRDRGDGMCARCRTDFYPCPDAVDLGVPARCGWCGSVSHVNSDDLSDCPTYSTARALGES